MVMSRSTQFDASSPAAEPTRSPLGHTGETLAARTVAPEYLRILESYRECRSLGETRAWADYVAEAIVALVNARPIRLAWSASPGASCPLCDQPASARSYTRGLLAPEWLRRHLLGWGSVRPCEVMEATHADALDAWRCKFGSADTASRVSDRARWEARRATEQLYRVDAHGAPLLLDESLADGRLPRTPEHLSWAIRRVLQLGFGAVAVDSVVSHVQRLADATVYADVRSAGQISFVAYLTKESTKPHRVAPRYASFALEDALSGDLYEIYCSRRHDALYLLSL